MFAATKGVNTHKGTIFSLRILTGAVGVLKQGNQMINQANLQRVVRQMLADLLATDLDGLKKDTKLTAGNNSTLPMVTPGFVARRLVDSPPFLNMVCQPWSTGKGQRKTTANWKPCW